MLCVYLKSCTVDVRNKYYIKVHNIQTAVDDISKSANMYFLRKKI